MRKLFASSCPTNDLDEPFQSAYKSLHSTETALLRVHDDILRAIDSNRSFALLLLDLSAAFDLVDHGILLQHLQFCSGIKGDTLSWFQSYLSDHRQYMYVCGESLTFDTLHPGVPQESVLGPILYLLYTSLLGNSVTKHDMLYRFCADDSKIYMSNDLNLPGHYTTRFEACINDVSNWMSKNNLVPRVLSLPPSRKYPGFGWSRVSLKQTAPHQGGLAFLQEAKRKANANLFKLARRQRNGSH